MHRIALQLSALITPRNFPPCSATPLRHVQRAAGTPASVQRHSSPACSTSSRHPGLRAAPFLSGLLFNEQQASRPPCSATPLLRPLVDSEPISQPSSSSSSSCPSPSLGCSCYGLQPALAPLSFVRWLTPSPSTSPPRCPPLRRASAAATTGCSLPWRPSPSSAG